MATLYKTKKKVSFTVDIKSAEKFVKIAKANSINQSSWIQRKIDEFIEEYENKK